MREAQPARGQLSTSEKMQARQEAARAGLRRVLPHPDGQSLCDLLESVRLIGEGPNDGDMRAFYRSLGVLPDAGG
jgi:hypothetical protein